MDKSVRPIALGSGIQKRRYTISHADLTDNDTAQTIDLFTLHQNDAVFGVRIKHSTRFLGGGASTMTVSVGGSVDGAAGYATAYDIFAAVADTSLQWSQCLKNGTAADAGQTVQATFTTDATCLGLTAGQVDIDVYVMADTVKAIS